MSLPAGSAGEPASAVSGPAAGSVALADAPRSSDWCLAFMRFSAMERYVSSAKATNESVTGRRIPAIVGLPRIAISHQAIAAMRIAIATDL